MGRTPALLTLVAAIATITMSATAATAAAPATPAGLGAARLEGPFLLAGRVTLAKLVPGERVGQLVSRTWTFTPACATGACDTIRLVRQRETGSDRVTLHRGKPGYYVGKGTFFAPLRCAKRVYPNGAAVPFTITVQVTAALQTPTDLVASRVNATYVNLSRRNLTPCVGVLGHDAAVYHGHLLLGPPPTGGAGA
ncbi:MAG TPA: hypothetical protein VMU39_18240 [Solirubrobacteraceae bacterium]|nr:hypothetical protein [Solirubrobacteraceae bacterium]